MLMNLVFKGRQGRGEGGGGKEEGERSSMHAGNYII